jgi:SulP family sulfate permease
MKPRSSKRSVLSVRGRVSDIPTIVMIPLEAFGLILFAFSMAPLWENRIGIIRCVDKPSECIPDTQVFLNRYLPVIDWARSYRRPWLRLDVIAGVTTAAVVIPKAMAMATVAGLPVALGLYTMLLPMAIYAMMGTSRRLSMSTTSTIAMLTGTALMEVVPKGTQEEMVAATATLTLLVGATLLLASALKLGSIANFISDPVLTGFKMGLGLAIVADQTPKLLGIHFAKAGFLRDLVTLFQHLPETSAATLSIGAATLILIFGLRRFWPGGPGALFAVAGGIGACWLLGLEQRGVAVVGHMPSGLPGFQFPGRSLIYDLWPAAIGIALMSFTETVAVGRAFAGAGDPRPQPDQELRALGLANLVGSMFHAMPAGGGTSETAVNSRAGAQTQMSELVTVAAAVLAVLFLAPLISLMPLSTLAAVVIATTAGLLSPKELLNIRDSRKREFWWGIAAVLGVVLLGTLRGILVAVLISLIALMYETNRAPVYALARKPGTTVFRPRSEQHPEDEVFTGLLLVRTEGRMYFANAQRAGDKMLALVHEAKPKVVVLDCSAIPDIEYTALRMLTSGEERLREEGIELWLAGLTPVALDLIRRSPLGNTLGRDRMLFDLEHAVARYQAPAQRPPEPVANVQAL